MDYLYYDLYIQADGEIIANEDSSHLFAYMENLEEINNIEYLNTENVEDMSGMFSSDTLLEEVDVSNFDTSNVTDMNSMFLSCGSLSEIDVSNFNTEKVTDMNQMFYECVNITSLDLDVFDTSEVTNMYAMFCMCESLESLDLSNFDTSKVYNMGSMFDACLSLTSVDLSSFNTSNIQYISYMFSSCAALTSLDISNFNLSKVEEIEGMFREVLCDITIPATTGSLTNTSTILYGKSSDVYIEWTFSVFDPALVPLKNFITKAKAGNATASDVGTTFSIDMGTLGTHTLRVANVSTPSACSGTDFSGTACGVVMEFADIVVKQKMHSSGTTVGGWPARDLYTYVNNDVYNALPQLLKSNILTTKVISGQGSSDSGTGPGGTWVSNDKLYLLSPHEIWELTDDDDTPPSEIADYYYTRQLDYYDNLDVGTFYEDNIVKKYNGTDTFWWLRTANYTTNYIYYRVDNYGSFNNYFLNIAGGVSPAFRIA